MIDGTVSGSVVDATSRGGLAATADCRSDLLGSATRLRAVYRSIDERSRSRTAVRPWMSQSNPLTPRTSVTGYGRGRRAPTTSGLAGTTSVVAVEPLVGTPGAGGAVTPGMTGLVSASFGYQVDPVKRSSTASRR